MSTALDASSLLDALNRELGDGGVVTDGAELRFYSMDLMWSGPVATAVARPRSVAQVVALTRIAAAHGVALVPRGGGMSYTMGYVPQHARSVIVDLTALDRIVEINETDMYVTAEAGCSWKVLYEALAARGLRTPYFGPVSGVHATVGGAVSQGSMFFGSGTYGPVAESVLSVRTVLGNGSVIKTGARANRGDVPFNRYYGPDLTGLFLSDTGAMGIKVEVSIRLMRMPKGLACASYGFERFEDLYEAQAEIARHRIVAECFALDPFLGGKRTNLQSWTEGVRTLADVAKARGLADAVKVARGGTRFLEDCNYSMHLTVDGIDDEDARRKLAIVEQIALRHGGPIESTIPTVLRSRPFQHVGEYLLGEGGLRWIPIHANLPISKVPEAYRRTMAYYDSKRELMERHGVKTGFSTSIAGTDMIFEPQFFWPDELTEFHARHVPAEKLKAFGANPARPEAREVVVGLMRDLTAIYMELGAVHQQIGKFYRYEESLDPVNFELLRQIRKLLDPDGIINPGSLGLS